MSTPPPTQPEQWESDQQAWSMFLDHKAEQKAIQEEYIRSHPEIRNLVSDYIQHMLVKKPDNVVEETRAYFSQFKQ
eukprot:m.127180 g.127180  ORF g.127180 m.127180 type:complete len:76 (-) comp13850_c2_seq1:150-377(-)